MRSFCLLCVLTSVLFIFGFSRTADSQPGKQPAKAAPWSITDKGELPKPTPKLASCSCLSGEDCTCCNCAAPATEPAPEPDCPECGSGEAQGGFSGDGREKRKPIRKILGRIFRRRR